MNPKVNSVLERKYREDSLEFKLVVDPEIAEEDQMILY